MSTDGGAAATLASEIEQLELTTATLWEHRQHFESLIAVREQDSTDTGFFAAVAEAVSNFVDVIESSVFGHDKKTDGSDGDSDQPTEIAAKGSDSRPGLHGAVDDLRASVAEDATDTQRADTLAHLQQATAEIDERLRALASQIADRRVRLEDARASDRGNEPADHDGRRENDHHRPDPAIFPSYDRTVDVDPHSPRRSLDDPELDPVRSVVTDIDLPPLDPTDVHVSASDHNVDMPPIDIIQPFEPPPIVTPTDVVDPAPDPTVDVVDPAPDPTVDAVDPLFDPTVQEEIGDLDGEIYDVNELLQSGVTVAELRSRDVPAGVLIGSGVEVARLIDGGYTFDDLREAEVDLTAFCAAGVSIASLHQAGVSLEELRTVASLADLQAIATPAELRAVGFSVAELASVFTVNALKEAGCSVSDLQGHLSLSDLRSAFDLAELCAHCSAYDLRVDGASASDLHHAGIAPAVLAEAGFTYHDLLAAGVGAAELQLLFPFEASVDRGTDPAAPDDAFFR